MREPSEVPLQIADAAVADLCSAIPAARAMSANIAPLYRGARIAGPARTALTIPGQNAAIHRAASVARAGEVIVVSYGDTASGPFGELLAMCCMQRGIAGLVIDGAVRDSDRLVSMGFPVFCLGTHPGPTGKSHHGEIDVDIVCGGVTVRPGDVVVADDDGVVVIPPDRCLEAADDVRRLRQEEAEFRRRLENGESTCEILGITGSER